MTEGSAVMLVPGLFSGCDRQPLAALEGWSAPRAMDDIRLAVLSYALLAPNPHNKQPWIVDLRRQGRIELYVDPERLLPETDPFYRQIHIGQGTFLESLHLAAAHFGYRADIEYFPAGMYGNTVLEHRPVAAIELVGVTTRERDSLFDAILRRQSNRRVFLDRPLSQQQIDGIRSALPASLPDFSFGLTLDAAQRSGLTEFATEAMRIEVADNKRIAESVAMFRFSDDELAAHRDGFGVPQMGAEGVRKYLIENVLISRKSFLAPDSSFGEQSAGGSRKQAASAAGFGWLVSKNNTRLDQIVAGRIYNRINLMATAQGVAIHPMSQILQEYADVAALQQQFKRYLGIPEPQTIQMFFRLGIAEPVQHTARRRVEDLLAAWSGS
jgi:hypothetical protein